MKFIAIIAAFLAGMITGMSLFSRAADLYLDVNGFSRHSQKYYTYQGQRQAFNEDNAGLGLTSSWTDNVDLTAGFYRNSYAKPSVYGGANLHMNFKGGPIVWRPGVSVGLVSGYDNTPDHAGVVRLAVMPNVAISTGNLGVKIGYVPARKASRGAAVYGGTLSKDGNFSTSTVGAEPDDASASAITVQFQYQIN